MDLNPLSTPDGSTHTGYVLSMSRVEYMALRRVVLSASLSPFEPSGLLRDAEVQYIRRYRALPFPRIPVVGPDHDEFVKTLSAC